MLFYQAITKLDRPDESFRYATFTIAQTWVLFFLSWPSQRLADESTRISETTFVKNKNHHFNTVRTAEKNFFKLKLSTGLDPSGT